MLAIELLPHKLGGHDRIRTGKNLEPKHYQGLSHQLRIHREPTKRLCDYLRLGPGVTPTFPSLRRYPSLAFVPVNGGPTGFRSPITTLRVSYPTHLRRWGHIILHPRYCVSSVCHVSNRGGISAYDCQLRHTFPTPNVTLTNAKLVYSTGIEPAEESP